VRGICCLRPGVPGISETIEVRALIDRFLEHSRAFHFANAGKDDVYISSADWMPRNFHRRVETLIPIDDPLLRVRLIEILQLQVVDNAKTWLLQPDGKYARVQLKEGQAPFRAQARFIEMTRDKIKTAEATASGGRFSLSKLTRRVSEERSGEGRAARRRDLRESQGTLKKSSS
ncbi:MAG TPA: RNA degradosome polyphosphate kinase, partial [Polyangiaceae bacterium]|nr:RNA degradosome polyphosphate kinase [Polyangiaceae bacterium]